MVRHSIALLALSAGAAAWGADVSLVGTFESKAAILSIDGGAPRTVKVVTKKNKAKKFVIRATDADRNRLTFKAATLENLRHLNIADPRLDPEQEEDED